MKQLQFKMVYSALLFLLLTFNYTNSFLQQPTSMEPSNSKRESSKFRSLEVKDRKLLTIRRQVSPENYKRITPDESRRQILQKSDDSGRYRMIDYRRRAAPDYSRRQNFAENNREMFSGRRQAFLDDSKRQNLIENKRQVLTVNSRRRTVPEQTRETPPIASRRVLDSENTRQTSSADSRRQITSENRRRVSANDFRERVRMENARRVTPITSRRVLTLENTRQVSPIDSRRQVSLENTRHVSSVESRRQIQTENIRQIDSRRQNVKALNSRATENRERVPQISYKHKNSYLERSSSMENHRSKIQEREVRQVRSLSDATRRINTSERRLMVIDENNNAGRIATSFITKSNLNLWINTSKIVLLTFLFAQIITNSSKSKKNWCLNNLANFVNFTKEKVL